MPGEPDADRDAVLRRIKAAQALGGYTSVEALADAVKDAGIGLKRLRAIWQLQDDARAVELREIARACGVPYGLFTLDLRVALDEHRGNWQESIEHRLHAIETTLSGLGDTRTFARQAIAELEAESERAAREPTAEESRDPQTQAEASRPLSP